MRDLKDGKKRSRTRANRRVRKKEPRNWGQLLRRLTRTVLLLAFAGLVVVAGFLAGRLLLDWGYFKVDTIRVVANERVSRDEIVALSDIRPGDGIFDLNLERIGRKIEENPWIAAARVRRIFPGEVVIEVKERVPGAILSLGYLYYVDWEGEIFKLLSPEDRLDYPVITGITQEDLTRQPDRVRRRLRQAMLLLRQLKGRRSLTLEDISEVHVGRDGGFELTTYVGGVPIRLGYGHFAAKLDRLEKVYKELRPQLMALKYIDLNVSDRVIVSVATPQTVGKG
ncbi:cell division protein FtsQ [Geothermobacter ehrlichii]|uniref:Cell division protein FtsQ n=1 Tax=Geothermobacter ehrlichii TaxID=213224 RepID=A0A5D3WJP2_9BACT|nr:FtsQ-type POTRA domain-containing protein [Geothermobacter ehrlichii]TYO96098.1 cell division protein FtsQ [Geothermobacter ehrlichii]